MSKFYNSPVTGVDGFNYSLQVIKKVEETFVRPNPVFMESTGIYHLNLFYFLINNKVDTYVINPLVTNCNKNKEIRKIKNDKSDYFSIAKPGKFENIKTCNTVDLNIYELRLLVENTTL